MTKRSLPEIQDLQSDSLEAFKHDQLKQITNHEPKKEWLKKHPMAKGVVYLPIDKIEFLMDRIFQQWKVEVIDYKQLFNSVSCHIRLHYLDPIKGEWKYHDGLGAVGVQTDKGKGPSSLDHIKQDAVMKGLPAAKSYAIKDAADHLGKLFGRDLNRKDTLPFTPSRVEKKEPSEEVKRLRKYIAKCTDMGELKAVEEAVEEHEELWDEYTDKANEIQKNEA